MSEYIVRMPPDMPYEIRAELNAWYIASEPIVRCRDCECLDTWEFADGTVRNVCSNFEYTDVVLDGFCAWGERRDA